MSGDGGLARADEKLRREMPPDEAPPDEHGSARRRRAHGGRRRLAGALAALASATALPAAGILTSGGAAAAQTSVAPVLSCSGGMVLDAASGTCLTPRAVTSLRPSSCPSGSTPLGGEYGGDVCQRKVTETVDTGRTRQVYSHTTYSRVWVPAGTKQVQTGTNRTWVPSRTTIEPLVPPVRVQVGTRTETKRVTRPGPAVLYKVSYTVQVPTRRVVRRCSFDPLAGRQCWDHTVTETRAQTRTRLECCIPGPPVTTTVTTRVPVYEYRTTHTVTVPGYWRETPVYESRETGYWDRVGTRHYTTEPVYETVVEWVTSPARRGSCPSGWRASASQCSRTVLGPPTAAPTQRCPSGSAPRYGDPVGGSAPVLACRSSAPGSDPDDGDDPEDGGGPDATRDGGARPLHHLAGESDERLAELGIHRCANGLLSYVPCSELPGRAWDSDPGICDGIEGTAYRRDHGGTCVTGSDLLNKCTTPGDCEDTTIRTYCPAIRELSTTQIQQHVHPHRGAETYRVCVFDCSDFAGLPPYVRTRINGSYDYGCLPAPEEEPLPTTTAALTPTTTTTPDDDAGDDPADPPGTDPPDAPDSDVTVATTEPTSTTVPTATTGPPAAQCPLLPPLPLSSADDAALGWQSHVRSGNAASTEQVDMPGGGLFLQVAPGRGWMQAQRAVQISDPGCIWTVTKVRTAWSELRPWIVAERRRMEAEPTVAHLVKRWDALSTVQQQVMRRWHRPGAVPAEVECSMVDAMSATASSDCDWLLSHPGAYDWRFDACFDVAPTPGRTGSGGGTPPSGSNCWATLASGVDWIRPVSDYADGRVTVSHSGAQP